jgi:hypothetical protein
MEDFLELFDDLGINDPLMSTGRMFALHRADWQLKNGGLPIVNPEEGL